MWIYTNISSCKYYETAVSILQEMFIKNKEKIHFYSLLENNPGKKFRPVPTGPEDTKTGLWLQNTDSVTSHG